MSARSREPVDAVVFITLVAAECIQLSVDVSKIKGRACV